VIQRADPKTRRRAIIAVFVAGLLAVAAYAAADHWLAGVGARPPLEARQALAAAIRWGSASTSMIAVAFALYVYALGRRVVAAQRFPPEGMAVIRDTPVLEGRPARTRGFLIQAVAAALAVTAAALPVAAFRVAALLE
jgi:hypothetical protein